MKGLVSLVGAGPAAGLITLRGAERLGECEAVVYDDLVAPETLGLAPERAELIYMGKRAGRTSSDQVDIINKLIELARAGRRVVRLKGGDPYIFGRGGEEMLALAEAGVPCEEIPGVTSASAVPALCGIPLTHRGLSRGFTVVTAHTAGGGGLPDYFDSLASVPGTLVVLMGLGKLGQIAGRLIETGRAPGTPCAVVSEGEIRRCVRGTLSDIAVKAAGFAPPAVIVIGECAALDLRAPTMPLAGARAALTGTARMNAKLAREISRLGGEGFTAFEAVLRPLPGADEAGPGSGCLVFTSAAGVELYFERLTAKGLDARALAGLRLACVGRATAAALAARSLRADLVPAEQTTDALGELLLRSLEPGESVCLYRSGLGGAGLARKLAEKFDVRDVRAYSAAPGERRAEREAVEGADFFVFTSAATARMALDALGKIPEKAALIAIGGPTAQALAGLPNRIAAAREPSAAAVAEKMAELWAGRG